MTKYFAFLRGINLGKRRLKMDVLAAIFVELGFENVSTFIASGNVIFDSKSKDAAKLEEQIEKKLHETLGYEVETFLRTAAEMAALGALDPFPKEPWQEAGWNVHVVFHKQEIDAAEAKKITKIRTDYDAFAVMGRELFWLCHGPMTDSTVWKLPEMKLVSLPANTMRNRKTVMNLVEKYKLGG